MDDWKIAKQQLDLSKIFLVSLLHVIQQELPEPSEHDTLEGLREDIGDHLIGRKAEVDTPGLPRNAGPTSPWELNRTIRSTLPPWRTSTPAFAWWISQRWAPFQV
mmetsp:Transcript_23737/g.33972  ORF Transcript_23737/g.33972 Transcript_23737/m.33972 type:complete len:105 (-) Transcript_23737:971-1285(-)